MIDFNQLTEFSKQVFDNASAKGFHDADQHENEVQCAARHTANLHGEVSELWEAARKGDLHKPCDKDAYVILDYNASRKLTCAEEELADIVIRACDTAATLGIDIGAAVKAKHEYNKTRAHKHGGKLA